MNDKPAYPQPYIPAARGVIRETGMSRREEFIKAAMQGLIASDDKGGMGPETVAEHAAKYADATLAAIDGKTENRETTTTKILHEILKEREHQFRKGFIPLFDKRWISGELIDGAICYANVANAVHMSKGTQRGRILAGKGWPFARQLWKPEPDTRQNLIKAAAMLVAEIARIDAAEREEE